MFRKKHSIFRVPYYPWFEASTGGLGTYPVWIRERMSCCLKIEANSGTGHRGPGLPGRYTIHCGPLEFKPLENSGILCGTSLWVISPSPQRWESWGIDPPNPIHHELRAVLRAIHSQHPWPVPKMESPRCKATGACRNAGFLEPEQGVLSSCYDCSIPCPCLKLNTAIDPDNQGGSCRETNGTIMYHIMEIKQMQKSLHVW